MISNSKIKSQKFSSPFYMRELQAYLSVYIRVQYNIDTYGAVNGSSLRTGNGKTAEVTIRWGTDHSL